MALALVPAVADPLSGTDEYPDVAFLARNDVPFDAQTAASMAAQLGAPMYITNPNVLADAAHDGIADLNPDVIIVAGGVFAISDAVANAAAAACDPDCTVDRYAGTGRDDTAAELAGIAAKYGFDRPLLQGTSQVVGDVNVGGTLNVDALTVQDMDVVAGLNADRVDGQHASDLLGASEKAADSDLLDGNDSTDFLGASDKAADSDLLDGSDSTDFLPATGLHPVASAFIDLDPPGVIDDTSATGFVDARRPEAGVVCLQLDPELGLTPSDLFVQVSPEWGTSNTSDMLTYWRRSGSGCNSDEVEVRAFEFARDGDGDVAGVVASDNVSFVATAFTGGDPQAFSAASVTADGSGGTSDPEPDDR